MTAFSFGVQSVCLGVLGALLVYTLALVRSGRLNARVTVSWVLAELGAMGAVLLWGRLPVIGYTSSLGDRELLVVLAVLFFSFVVYLMLDSLQRISAQSQQIARLTQELALLRADQQGHSPGGPARVFPDSAGHGGERSAVQEHPPTRDAGAVIAQWLFALWLIVCVSVFALQGYGRLPEALLRTLTASLGQ